MVKLRDAGYCNLKLFALYITIYAHLIEPQIWENQTLYRIYQFIYFFHMPLFAFLSGLFLKNAKACAKQAIRALLLYVAAQSIYLLARDDVRWHTPYWHLWYLLSLSFWAALGAIWYRLGSRWGIGFLVLWGVIGCLAGKEPEIARKFSFSRSLVFLPYFWAGLILRRPVGSHKWLGAVVLTLGCLAAWSIREKVGVVFLYQAAAYGENGAVLRLQCYLAGALLCLGFVLIRPQRRYAVSKAGTDTLWAYLLHAPMVRTLWDYGLHPAVLALIPLLYIWLLFTFRRWYAAPCGIVPGERRHGPWRHLRKYMRPTQGPCTDSSLR